ncbi:MAG: lipid-binding SYLF domain-containing protein [Candidatus Omnitrophota bacterium]|nr:lipid-binding SYLF domain-containing protein [Candidatus Omnitrophota bacterium]
MPKRKKFLPVIIFFILIISIAVFLLHKTLSYPENKWTRLIVKCAGVVDSAGKAAGEGIMNGPIANCEAVGIFPSTISGGFGLGGQYGQGIILVKHDDGWSPPAIFTLAGGSIGWQIGAQATDIILVFMDAHSVDAILRGKMKLGVDASVAAGPVGRNVSAATDAQLRGGILSYSISRGLFIGAKVEGAVLLEHEEANEELYGKPLTAREILIEDKAVMPKAAYAFFKTLQPDNPVIRFLRKIGVFK